MHLSRAACMAATPGTLIARKERARAHTHQLCTGRLLGAPSPASLKDPLTCDLLKRLRPFLGVCSGPRVSALHTTFESAILCCPRPAAGPSSDVSSRFAEKLTFPY